MRSLLLFVLLSVSLGFRPSRCEGALLQKLRHLCSLALTRSTTFGYSTVEFPLQKQVHHFSVVQRRLSEQSALAFERGHSLGPILEDIRLELRSQVLAKPTQDRSFDSVFGLRRIEPSSSVVFTPNGYTRLRHGDPEVAYDFFAAYRELKTRLGFDAPTRRELNHFLHRVYHIERGYYSTLEGEKIPATLFFTAQGGVETEDVFYSFPGFTMAEQILIDAEARLELARTLPYAEREEQFYTALYGYVLVHPFERGNHTIGTTVFSGIYLALMGQPIVHFLGADEMAAAIVGGRDAFIDYCTLRPSR